MKIVKILCCLLLAVAVLAGATRQENMKSRQSIDETAAVVRFAQDSETGLFASLIVGALRPAYGRNLTLNPTPIVSQLDAFWLVILCLCLVLIHLIFYCVPKVRKFFKDNRAILTQTLPNLEISLSAISIGIAILALVPGNQPQRFEAPLIFISFSVLFLFLYIYMSFFKSSKPLPYFLSLSFISSAIYCFGLGLFAVVDVLLPESGWRFWLLAAPSGAIVAVIASFILILRSGRGTDQG